MFFPRFVAVSACVFAIAVGQPQPQPGAATGEGVTIEKLETTYDFSDDGSAQIDYHARIRMLSDAGVRQLGVAQFAYRKDVDTLQIRQIRVTKPDGSVIDTPASTAQDLDAEVTRQAPTYSDLREKHVPVRGLGIGDVLEWNVHVTRSSSDVPGQFWLAHSFTTSTNVLDETLTVTVPEGKYVKTVSALNPAITETAGRKKYVWATSHSADPRASTPFPRVSAPRPSVQITTFKNWNEIGAWYLSLLQPQAELTPAIKTKAAELTGSLKTDDEKLRAIYKFISLKLRYVSISLGVGHYQPHTADDVLANQFGDCKDQVTLFVALAKAAGIQVLPALVGAGADLDPDAPSPAQFNHLIAFVPGQKAPLWLDTTASVAPYGWVSSLLQDRKALVISRDGSASLLPIPQHTSNSLEDQVTVESKLGPDGTLAARVEMVFRSEAGVGLKNLFLRTSAVQWPSLVANISSGLGLSATAGDVKVDDLTDLEAPFHLSYSYRRESYSDWSNRRIVVPFPLFPFPFAEGKETPTEPMAWGSPTWIYARTSMELPDGYAPRLPAPAGLDNSLGLYSSTYSTDGKTLFASRLYRRKTSSVPPKNWADYQNLAKVANTDQNQTVQLDPAALTQLNPQADDLLRKASASLDKHDLKAANDSLVQLEKLDPKTPGLWTLYGLLYAGQNQLTKALDALAREIQQHPQDPTPYKYGATIMGQLGKNQEEMALRRQVIRLTPNDRSAYLDLAMADLRGAQFAEAIQILEPLASGDEPDVKAALLLTQSYLLSGKSTEGLALFKKVKKESLTPIELNDIAFLLADRSIDVNLAKQLADLSLAQNEAPFIGLSFGALTTEQLRRPYILAGVWDTVGWVYFRLGDTEKALRFLDAAWNLGQSLASANHLGQVYEQQGKQLEAVHAYQLALAVNPKAADVQKRLDALPPPSVPATRVDVTSRKVLSPREELSRMRSTPLSDLKMQDSSADFLLLFSAAGLDDARFLHGSETLKDAAAVLKAVHYKTLLPGDPKIKIPRRGMVTCSKYTTPTCSLVLLPPLDASVD